MSLIALQKRNPILIENQNTNNYAYDGSGNLVMDQAGGVKEIRWSVYGKVLQVERNSDKFTLFRYDAAQNRVYKEFNDDQNTILSATYYIRDAQGNTLAVYNQDENGDLIWQEQYLYGSSRMGVFQPKVEMTSDNTPIFLDSLQLFEGNRKFELTNHLGNVLAAISDRRRGVDVGLDGFVDYYESVVLNAQDYYPFGMLMPGRSYSALGENYRFGFNGKELDQNGEFGSLNHYDYGFRIYCAPCGRFLSVDPLAAEFVAWSPYSYTFDNPIRFIDPDGRAPSDANCCPGDEPTPSAAGILYEAYLSADVAIFNFMAKGMEALGYGKEGINIRKEILYDRNGGVYGTQIVEKSEGTYLEAAMETAVDILSLTPLTELGMAGRGMNGVFLAARIPNPKATFANFLRRGEQGQSLHRAKGGDFQLFHSESEIVNAPGYDSIKSLSDSELLNAINNPTDGQYIKVNSETGKLMNGNTRLYELQRRGLGSEQVTFESYTPPSNSEFFYDFD